MKARTTAGRFGSVLLATMMLAACGGSGDDTASTDTTEADGATTETTTADATETTAEETSSTEAADDAASGEPIEITFMQGVKGDEFYISMECGVQDAAAELNANVTTQGPDQFDATLQNPMLDAIAAANPAALLVAPNDVEASAGPLQRIQDGGTQIVLVDTQVNDETIGVSRIASDNLAGGAAAADALAELIGESGDVLVVNTKPGISTTDQRQQGFEEAIAAYGDINYVGTEFSQNDPATAAQIVTAALAANPELKGIFATNLFSAQGAATGLAQAGKSGDVQIVGFDAGPAQIEQLKAGDVQALVVQKPYDIGYQGVQQAVAAVNGDAVEATIQTDFVVATADNLADPEIDKYLYKSSC